MAEVMGSASDAPEVLCPEKSRSVHLKWWRRLVQTAALAVVGQWSFYGIFRCPFIVPYVSCQNCPVITCHGRLFTMFWGLWLVIPLSVLLFGRAFCGWACPGGLVNQLFGHLAFKKLRVRHRVMHVAAYAKYLGLALALLVWLAWDQPRLAIPIRVGEFFNSVLLTFEHANLFWLVRTFVILGFLALGLVLANAWCRFACPTGGLLEAVKSISLFKIYKNHECNDCDQCLTVCEMGTRPAENNCTNCGDCLSICPTDAIKIGRPQR